MSFRSSLNEIIGLIVFTRIFAQIFISYSGRLKDIINVLACQINHGTTAPFFINANQCAE